MPADPPTPRPPASFDDSTEGRAADRPDPTAADPRATDRVVAEGAGGVDGEGSAGTGRRVVRYRLRRTPNIAAFLIAGGLLGAILGLVVDLVGPDSRCAPADPSCVAPYQAGSTLGYLVTAGIIVGVGIGAIAAVILDRLWDRRG